MKKWTEPEVAEAVIAFFQERDFECFPEVSVGGPRADIVAVHGPLYVWIETKTSLNSAVMAQARRAMRQGAHRIYVAAPLGRRSEGKWFLEQAARRFGIGVLTVQRGYKRGETGICKEAVPAKWIRNPPYHQTLKKACQPDTRIANAGEAGGVFMTDFRRTMNQFRTLVRKSPGMTTKELLAAADHHYASDSSARGSLHRYAQTPGFLEKYGLETKTDARTRRWYVVEETPGAE